MDRLDKLKQLKDEIGRLFVEGLNETEIYGRLQAKSFFADFNRKDIHTLYARLNKKAMTEDIDEVWEHETQSDTEDIDKIWEYETQSDTEDIDKIWEQETQSDTEMNDSQNEKKHESQLDIDEHQFSEDEYSIVESDYLNEYRQNTKKFLLYEESNANPDYFMDIWQSRFFVTLDYSSAGIYTFNVQDMFQNASKSFTIQQIGRFSKIYALSFPFFLFYEHSHEPFTTYFRLLRLDLSNGTLQVVQTIEYNDICYILIDQFNSSEFILKKSLNDQVENCKLIQGKIQIGEKIDLDSTNICASYYDGKLYDLMFYFDELEVELELIKMFVYDLKQKKNTVLDLKQLSGDFHFADFEEYKYDCCKWVKDHVFTTIHFCSTDEYGIVFAEPQTCRWTVVEFAINIPINHIQFVDGQNLMIYAKQNNAIEETCKREIYKIPIRKPDLLRYIAWLKLVKKFKEDKVDDPYAEARNFLPLNSDIQQFIFIEDH